MQPALKWPNDVSPVTETGGHPRRGGGAQRHRRLGIGLNVTLRADEAGDPAATSLLDLGVADPTATV